MQTEEETRSRYVHPRNPRVESKKIGERQEEQEEDAGADVGCDRGPWIRSRRLID